jgi:hypothetical protein
VKNVEAPGEITSASLISGRLFLCVKGIGLVEVELESGKSLREWKLAGAVPHSIAVFPARGVAIFPESQRLTALDLETGTTEPTDYYVDAVAADPAQRFCYCYKKSENRPEVGHIIINGRPILLQREFEWTQTALLKFAIADKQPLLAELRMNAASNGWVLHVSPDGEWVTIGGGGGWRPDDDEGRGHGYGAAVFATRDLSHVQGSIPQRLILKRSPSMRRRDKSPPCAPGTAGFITLSRTANL